MYYNYFRDYDPAIGRYVQSDPIGLAGGLTTFAYTHDDPLRFTDRKGLMSDKQCCQVSIQKGQDEGDSGWPICCNGRKVGCSNINPNSWNSSKAASLVAQCAESHERDHFPSLKPCTCGMQGVDRLDARDPIDTPASECFGYARTVACLRQNTKKCGNDATCVRDMKHAVRSAGGQGRSYCRGSQND
jgi:uncharacterized protein RhaS with RHS repeats